MSKPKINNLDDLEKSVAGAALTAKQKRQARYRLARDLGFKADEASYLQNRPEIIIRRLGEEKLARGGK